MEHLKLKPFARAAARQLLSLVFIALTGSGIAAAQTAGTGVVLSGGKLVATFANPATGYNNDTFDRLDSLIWTDSTGTATANLVAEGGNENCNDAREYFGQSYGVPEGSTPGIIFGGTVSTASGVTATTLTATTSANDCNGNRVADASAVTHYQVFPTGDPDQSEMRLSRTINFAATPAAFSFTAVTSAAPSSTQTSNSVTVSTSAPKFSGDGVHGYVPRLPLASYNTVLIPNAAGTMINTYLASNCGNDCEISDWNGVWFADDNGSGSGMVVFRDPSSTAPAAISINNDSISNSNLTSIYLIQPAAGWQAPVTETEWLCFYDPTTWPAAAQAAGTLPQGCAQSFSGTAAPATTAMAISITGGSYSVNGGPFVTTAGTVNNGDTVVVSSVASASYATTTAATLTINGVSADFDITTGATPAPTLTLAASPTTITQGQSSTLNWASTNATSCTASGGWSGTESLSGSTTVSPLATSSYTLTCTGAGGTVASTATVTVTAAPTVSLSASPSSVTLGQPSTLTWTSTNAVSCTASGAWNGAEATSGSLSVTPSANGSNTYTLSCTDANNVSVSSSAVVTATAPVPTVTLSLSPTAIQSGASAALSWTSTNATRCTASGAWSGTQATSGTMTESPTAAGSYTYTLVCNGAGGTSNTATQTLTVSAAPPPPPPLPTVTISSNPASITLGQSSVLTWTSTNAASCTASNAWSGVESTSGTMTETPATAGSFTYTLTCTNVTGSASASAAITVTAPAPSAPTLSLLVNSASTAAITLGESAMLSWSSTNATACTASGAWSGSEPTSGSLVETPAADGAYTYTLSCSGPGGVVTAAAVVTVSSPVATTTLSGKAGGGGFGFGSLFGLGLMALLRQRRSRRGAGLVLMLCCIPAFAQELKFDFGSAYAGVRGGLSSYSVTNDQLNSATAGAGGDTSSTVEHHKGVGVLYAGVPVYNGLALELGYADLGIYHVNIDTNSSDVAQVARDLAGKLTPAGRGITLGVGGPFDLGRWFAIEPHLGALIYRSRQEIFTPIGTFTHGNVGVGLDAGVALLAHPFKPLYAGGGFECFDTSSGCNVSMSFLQLEYHFGRRD